MSGNDSLSEREQEILKLVATGASNKEIAHKLYISTNTVKVHLRNIFGKIGASSRTEAAMYAVQNGLVESIGRVPQDSNGIGLTPISEALPKFRQNIWFIAIFSVILLLLLGVISYLLWTNSRQDAVKNPQSDTPLWQENSPMPTARFGLAATVYENLIYTFAGETAQGVTGVVETYDPGSNTWRTLEDKPTAVSDVCAAVLGGKIYVPGGRMQSGELTNRLEIYNPRSDAWSEGTPLPEAMSAYAMAVYEGKLYLFGGWDGENYLNIVLEYDPDQDTWNYKTPLSRPRAYAAAIEINGKIYLLGGFNGKDPLDLNEIYTADLDDGSGNPWTESVPLPSGRYSMGTSSVMENIYLVGGEGNGKEELPAYGFSTPLGQWQEIKSLPIEGLSNFGSVALGTDIYIIGGNNKGNPASSNLSYKVLYITVLPIMR